MAGDSAGEKKLGVAGAAVPPNTQVARSPAGSSKTVGTPKKNKAAKGHKSNASKKLKRNARPPRSVRLAQQTRSQQPRLRRDGFGMSVTVQMPAIKLHPKLQGPLQKVGAVLGKVHLPPKLAAKIPKVPRAVRRPALALAVLLIIGVAVFGIHISRSKPHVGPTQAAAAVRTVPSFKPLLPSAAEASQKTYDGKRDMVAYSTTFSGARLAVSQQPLPVRFTQSPQALQSAADSINAKQRIDTAKGPVFIATNETNDQLAVFAGQKVLLFIHTDRKLDDASWKAFIELLDPKS